MLIETIKEHEDGSATVTLDLDAEEHQAIIQVGFEYLLRQTIKEEERSKMMAEAFDMDFDEERMDIIGQNGNDGLHYTEWEGDPPTGYTKKPAIEYFIEPLHYPLGMYKLYSTVATDFGGVAVNYITEGTLDDLEKVKERLEKGDTKRWRGNPQGGYNLHGEPHE
ncbi:MAG: hypothetical protein P8I94_03685 [Emcibacteraceae bacterium]|nr:hypothetical protein [Emcibacteraceae bacterium]